MATRPPRPTAIPIQPPKAGARLAEGLRRALADPSRHAGAYVRLSASGGVHGEGYDFEYRVEADGRTRLRLADEMKQRRLSDADVAQRRGAAAGGPARFAAIVKSLDVEALLRTEVPSGGFLPDSVVGRLEVSDGEHTATFLFPAEETAAPDRKRALPTPLQRATDAVWHAAAEDAGTDVRP